MIIKFFRRILPGTSVNSLLQVSFITAGLALIVFSSGCNNSKDDQHRGGTVVNDTTPLGKMIAEASLKISKDPKNPDLYHNRAKLHLQRLDYLNALLDMSEVVKMDSTKAEYYLTIADAEFARGNSGMSKTALDKCLQLDPKNLIALERMAELYFYVKQYEKSIGYLDQILKADIRNPKAYFMKGMNFKEKGDTARAIGSFQTTIEQQPDYYDAYQQLGMIYTAQNNPLGIQYFDGALRIKPKSEEALYGRGMCYQEVKHDYDKAIQDYTSITQMNPQNSNAHFALGFIHFQYLKVYAEAVKHYTRAIDADPNWPEAIYNRGLAYESMGNIAAAKSDYEKALKIRADYALAQAGLKRVSQY
jgi:tetratricopeptide (TPR) repeat protein